MFKILWKLDCWETKKTPDFGKLAGTVLSIFRLRESSLLTKNSEKVPFSLETSSLFILFNLCWINSTMIPPMQNFRRISPWIWDISISNVYCHNSATSTVILKNFPSLQVSAACASSSQPAKTFFSFFFRILFFFGCLAEVEEKHGRRKAGMSTWGTNSKFK